MEVFPIAGGILADAGSGFTSFDGQDAIAPGVRALIQLSTFIYQHWVNTVSIVLKSRRIRQKRRLQGPNIDRWFGKPRWDSRCCGRELL